LSILAFDTATPVGSAALVDEERTIVGRYFDIGLQHSQRLFIEIEQVLDTAAVAIGEVEAIAVSIGPGSFTGLRIGLSAAKGFCLASGRPLIAVPTLTALAARLPFARHPVCAMLDARKGEVYTALFDNSTGWPRSLDKPCAMPPEALLERRLGEPTIYTGDGALVYRSLIVASDRQALMAPPHCARPEAGTIGHLALAMLHADPTCGLKGTELAAVEPLYLRKPDAKVAPKRFPRR
jgi:tRNA threonylcarbamoyladenosine biosynthesis protein TsaB